MSEDEKQLYKPISVGEFLTEALSELKIEMLAGVNGIGKLIGIPRVQKPGLTFQTEINQGINDRVQVWGKTEIDFLTSLDKENQLQTINKYCSFDLCCIIISAGLDAPAALKETCETRNIPLFKSSLPTGLTIETASRILRIKMAPQMNVHGVMMEILGLGVFIQGDPGIGKSESALDLITRGHRFVADDAITVRKFENDVLVGYCPELISNLLEIRGLGVINIRDLFGMGAVRHHKKIELIISLEPWKKGEEYDRLGLAEDTFKLMDCEVPLVRIPVAPGRNLAILIETAARNHLVKIHYGRALEEFEKKINRRILEKMLMEQEKDRRE